jgi:hypothetical protein
MTPARAREVLALYRPWAGSQPDAEMAAALALAAADADLRRWFDDHCRLQAAMRRALLEVPVPTGLRERVLAAGRQARPGRWWHSPWRVAALAAALVALLALAAASWWPAGAGDRFANFRTRMVRTALRQYRMDIVTNDMAQVRRYLASQGAPADYEVPAGLGRLALTGGGRLKWRGTDVSMVCFDRGDRAMLFLFVLDRAAINDPPPETARAAPLNSLATLSWSRGNRTYLLAGPDEAGFAERYQ